MDDDERFKKVFEKPEYLKDTHTGALINNDNSALAIYKRQKLASNRIEVVEQSVAEIKNDVAEMKALLLELLRKNK